MRESSARKINHDSHGCKQVCPFWGHFMVIFGQIRGPTVIKVIFNNVQIETALNPKPLLYRSHLIKPDQLIM